MMKSMLELPKLVQHLAGYVEVFGTEVESKLKVYRSVVLPTLLYACETWTVGRGSRRNISVELF